MPPLVLISTVKPVGTVRLLAKLAKSCAKPIAVPRLSSISGSFCDSTPCEVSVLRKLARLLSACSMVAKLTSGRLFSPSSPLASSVQAVRSNKSPLLGEVSVSAAWASMPRLAPSPAVVTATGSPSDPVPVSVGAAKSPAIEPDSRSDSIALPFSDSVTPPASLSGAGPSVSPTMPNCAVAAALPATVIAASSASLVICTRFAMPTEPVTVSIGAALASFAPRPSSLPASALVACTTIEAAKP